MKVFLSWSGERSKQVAELLKDWLPRVIQSLKPWVSTQDIQKGSLWSEIIGEELQGMTTGIICLTMENKERPWILFEAGALAKGLTTNRVCTFLIDLKTTDVTSPLSQFNHTNATDRKEILQLLKTLNDRLGDNKLAPSILENSLDVHWLSFQEKLNEIKQETPETKKTQKRTEYEILLEILENTRNISRTTSVIENTNNRGLYRHSDAHSAAKNVNYFIDLINEAVSAYETLPDPAKKIIDESRTLGNTPLGS